MGARPTHAWLLLPTLVSRESSPTLFIAVQPLQDKMEYSFDTGESTGFAVASAWAKVTLTQAPFWFRRIE